MIYGYCRISTKQQSIERQERNIKAAHPDAVIVKETYTGTKFQGRKELEKILKKIKPGDMICFDEVSRMARNADGGYELYEKLFNEGIILEFIKEPHINTETYRQAIEKQIDIKLVSGDEATDELMNTIVGALNRYILALAKRQIKLAFGQAEKEMEYLHQRTREGMETARLNGKRIGLLKGTSLITKKSMESKVKIKQLSNEFDGGLKDGDVMKLIGLSRNTYYKYKRELKEELFVDEACEDYAGNYSGEKHTL